MAKTWEKIQKSFVQLTVDPFLYGTAGTRYPAGFWVTLVFIRNTFINLPLGLAWARAKRPNKKNFIVLLSYDQMNWGININLWPFYRKVC